MTLTAPAPTTDATTSRGRAAGGRSGSSSPSS